MTFGLLMLIAAEQPLISQSPPPDSPPPSRGSWVAGVDYPIEALIKRWEGVASYTVTISPEGKAINCVITKSTGYKILDDATCSMVTSRARFNPATDEFGKPTAGTFSSRVRWVLPK